MQHASLLQNEEDKDLFIDAVLANMGVSSALFLCGIVRPLQEEFEMSATSLGRVNNVTTGAALYHLQRLALKGYVERTGYRRWQCSEYTYGILNKQKIAKDNTPHKSNKFNKEQNPFKEGEFIYGG